MVGASGKQPSHTHSTNIQFHKQTHTKNDDGLVVQLLLCNVSAVQQRVNQS